MTRPQATGAARVAKTYEEPKSTQCRCSTTSVCLGCFWTELREAAGLPMPKTRAVVVIGMENVNG